MQQRIEAVHGQAVGCCPGIGLGLCAVGDSGLLDRGVAFCLCVIAVVVLEQQRREGATHVPFDIVSEHAQEDVGAHAVCVVDVDRSHLEPGRLDCAECALDL